MTREQYIKDMIRQNGYTIKEFAKQIDMPYSTLLSIINQSIGGTSIDNCLRICKGLNITLNDLQGVSADSQGDEISSLRDVLGSLAAQQLQCDLLVRTMPQDARCLAGLGLLPR